MLNGEDFQGPDDYELNDEKAECAQVRVPRDDLD